MTGVCGVTNPLFNWATPAFAGLSKASNIANHLPVPQATSTDWSWNGVKVKVLRTLDLMPDLCTLTENMTIVTGMVFKNVPVFMRVTFASVASLNLFLVPLFLQDLYALVDRVATKLHKGVSFNQFVLAPYLMTLATTMAVICALGVKEFGRLFNFSSAQLDSFLSWTLPWIGYALRLGAILQIQEMINHLRFQSQLASSKTADDRLAVMQANRVYLRRANGHCDGLKKCLDGLERTWNPLTWSPLRGRNIDGLASDLSNRSVVYVHNQCFGLAANVFAVCAMVTTNAVGVLVFSSLSATNYISQNVHKWNMPAPVAV